MCYAQPGPRCSTHAKQALDKATAALEAAQEQARAASQGMASMNPDERRALLDDPNGAYRVAHRAIIVAREGLVAAENAYDATPAGMAELKAKMTAVEEEFGHVVVRAESPTYQECAQRLERGQQTRRNQMEAYKAIHQAEPWTDSRAQGDDAAAEEAALASVPDCTCITYKCKGDCEHLTPNLTGEQVDRVRREFLPTSAEASLRLHAANSRLRTLAPEASKWQAWLSEDESRTIQLPGMGAMSTRVARESNPEFAAFDDAYVAARREAQEAEEAFYATPGGQAYLRERANATAARMGYHTGTTHQDLERAEEAAAERAEAAAQFTRRTGRPAPAEETNPTPPTLMYGNGCPSNCHDFAWTGKCADTDDQMRQARRLQDAVSQMPQMQAMVKTIDKEFGEKRPGRLARLFGRG